MLNWSVITNKDDLELRMIVNGLVANGSTDLLRNVCPIYIDKGEYKATDGKGEKRVEGRKTCKAR